ncbi:MAG: UDP-3-O-acyl-N-acetylglucosamine deacetylase [Phycisphaeraceae bacterium]|nr:UDP-3-O-acyl-N-acetylglucosamine deacetylase [Phycisphaeraceae bacterium]
MVEENQKTIAADVTLEGKGLFMSQDAVVHFRPAPPNHGVVFLRTDAADGGRPVRIPAMVDNVAKRSRRTTLKRGEIAIETCEHCLSAIASLHIDNLLVEISGPELPGVDGSAQPYVESLQKAGLVDQELPRRVLKITEPITVEDGESMLAALPSDKPCLEVFYDLEYPGTYIGRQLHAFSADNGIYVHHIAPARTFVLETEVPALQQAGIGKHLTADDMLVVGAEGPIGNNRFRFDDEPVRHKVLDLIGDLSLVGCPIHGRIVAYKSGHALNHQLARRLVEMMRAQRHDQMIRSEGQLDIRKLQQILPHRFPMLLLDRVLEVDGDHRAVGVKNVSINEPYLQGHFPGTPIMPGVLIVEAMAQLSGVLLSNKLEHTGKLAVLLSMDKVKLRRPVTPGDQMVIEAESVRVRSRTGHTRCKAYVGAHLVAEAEIKFMLIDADEE